MATAVRADKRKKKTGPEWELGLASRKQSEKELDLKHFVPYQVVLLSGYFGDELQKVYRDYGLSISEWRVIACVAAGPANTAIDIATTSRLDEVAVHRAVTSLIQRGLLRRTQDEEDRRRKLLELTPKGLKVHANIVPRVMAFEEWALGKLPAAERKMLVECLSVFCERLGLVA